MCELSPERRTPPGFRFSASDGLVLSLAVAVVVVFRGALGALAWMPVVVLGHFFLFCNVFRVRRSYELLWSAAFVVNLSAWWSAGSFAWGPVVLVQMPVTLACILLEIFSPRYHGVGWSRIGRHGSRGEERETKPRAHPPSSQSPQIGRKDL